MNVRGRYWQGETVVNVRVVSVTGEGLGMFVEMLAGRDSGKCKGS